MTIFKSCRAQEARKAQAASSRMPISKLRLAALPAGFGVSSKRQNHLCQGPGKNGKSVRAQARIPLLKYSLSFFKRTPEETQRALKK